jgi:hypothetical protein
MAQDRRRPDEIIVVIFHGKVIDVRRDFLWNVEHFGRASDESVILAPKQHALSFG